MRSTSQSRTLGSWLSVVGASLVFTACLGDPVGPRGMVIVIPEAPGPDSVAIGAPGRTLPGSVRIRAVDDRGNPVVGAKVQWQVSGHGSVGPNETITGQDGRASATWTLGTNAADSQMLQVAIQTPSHLGTFSFHAIARPNEVQSLVLPESIQAKLGATPSVSVVALDPFANRFVPTRIAFLSSDTQVVRIDTAGVLHPVRRGSGRIVIGAGGVTDSLTVHVIQIVASVQVSPGGIVMHSLGAQQTLTVQLFDDQGLPVLDSNPVITVTPAGVIQADTVLPANVLAVANGQATIVIALPGSSTSVPVRVAQQVASVTTTDSAISFDALGDSNAVHVVLRDSLGAPIASAPLEFKTTDTSIATVDSAGVVRARSNGITAVTASASNGMSAVVPITVSQRVARIAVPADSFRFTALNAIATTNALALDRLNHVVTNAQVQYRSADTNIVAVSSSGVLRSMGNGSTTVTAAAGAESLLVSIQVAQRPTRVLIPVDTIHFVALGETQQIVGIAVDSLGSPVKGGVLSVAVGDTTVAHLADSVTIRSAANGSTNVSFTVAGLPAHVAVAVVQVPTSLAASLPPGNPIIQASTGTSVPVNCAVFDRNGFQVVGASPTVHSRHGMLAGGTCGTMTAARTGLDTLDVNLGGLSSRLPIAVAVPPTASSTVGTFLALDSVPAGVGAPWAPSLRRNSAGKLELYFAGYSVGVDSTGYHRANLYRYVSDDGTSFRYDGIALQHGDSICSRDGQGIENIAIVPRSDGPGWRMFYSGGSNKCYGWQVLSAVSTDERTWTKEPGVRLTNGIPGPSVQPPPPWPVGEGMAVFRLADGTWQMIVSGFRHVTPPDTNQWQIVEWRSPDQINWAYHDTVLTTSQMPAAGSGSIDGPSFRQVAPGLWRMLFAADNRRQPNSRSEIWSAVSLDREHWQLEGQLLGSSTTSLYYAAEVDGVLVFLRNDNGAGYQLASTTVQMP